MHDNQLGDKKAKDNRDNKVRLSQDVINKAEMIAAEWGLKNARAAVEAVFRRYSDEYLYGRSWSVGSQALAPNPEMLPRNPVPGLPNLSHSRPQCEALDELDQLLAT